ncbi:glycosyl hydrolase family 61 [Colletotrichum graminicola]|uniref:lytic cellulose monooxygenase (C4-dehydrogenating) n=1 Tax=Colletotrichum graminicola (strain M1.001 / M2 / FGSC 10212) TaxID=645133 RepID=E3Q8N0_COLGM|nr:glycosyl hydrolase family 61 [Colletotrichum graminicola M1.001]EFQ27394.1 glycosyl hydrolase family 61 [Colletotrichum graminicola M1.001]WDK13190.1 glycosyl hydrolase family 61 [Colletotrichum graminicola]
MRFVAFLAAAAIVPQAMAHYVFPALIVNGEETERYEFVRASTNSNSPVTDVTSDGFVCNIGANDASVLAKTKTKAVKAGDEIGFTAESDISHPGPLAVYMSKAPSGVASYKGDGDWFKVYELTTSDITSAGLQWASDGLRNFTFTLPKEVPTGEYLVRVEHTALHAAGSKDGAQFYISCAQISVTGGASGTPTPTVKIPGVYTGEEPGILINLYYPVPTSYTPAGPATWPNKCVDHTGNLAGQTSDGDCTGDAGATTPVAPAPSNGTAPETPSNGTTPEASDEGCEAAAARRQARSMRRRTTRLAL